MCSSCKSFHLLPVSVSFFLFYHIFSILHINSHSLERGLDLCSTALLFGSLPPVIFPPWCPSGLFIEKSEECSLGAKSSTILEFVEESSKEGVFKMSVAIERTNFNFVWVIARPPWSPTREECIAAPKRHSRFCTQIYEPSSKPYKAPSGRRVQAQL